MTILDWQKDSRLLNKDRGRELTDMEKQMLNDQWKKEEEMEREMER